MFKATCWAAAVVSVASVSNANAAYFEAIKDPSCIDSHFAASQSFSTGEQYNDSNNGVILDRWSMLSRWQGANEQNFVNNNVIYDMGAFTGLHGAYQRGVSPERSDGTAGVQLNCYHSGMLINTWTVPHRPVVGGSYNDMIGYAFHPAYQVNPFEKDGVHTHLVLQSNIAVPAYEVTHNTVDGENQPYPLVAHIGLFAYLRDTTHPGYAPIAITAITHGSDLLNPELPPGTGEGQRENYLVKGNITRDYSANLSNEYRTGPYSYWFANTPSYSSGVWFASAPITSLNDQRYVTKMYSEGDLNSNLLPGSDINAPMPFWRAHVTRENLFNIVQDINNKFDTECGGDIFACPPVPPGGYSTNPSHWVLEYAGVIAEASVVSDIRRGVYDASRTSWGGDPNGPTPYADVTKDQIGLAVRTYATGIYRYYP